MVVREWVASGVGAALTDTFFNPMENIKVRLQLQTCRRRRPLYRGLVASARKIAREDGAIRGLWMPGLLATWLRGISYTGLRVGLYPSTKTLIGGTAAAGGRGGGSDFAVMLCAGGLTGAIGSAIFTPVDVVRIRLQAEAGRVEGGILTSGLRQGRPPEYSNTFHAFAKIYREEGLRRGLWRGCSACVSRAVLLSAAQLATYDHFKQTATASGWMQEGVALHFTASFLSALVAQTVAMPADTVRTRCLTDGGLLYRGAIDCLIKTVRYEGASALFKGFVPAMARQGPVMVVQMPIIEFLRDLIGVGYI